MGNITYVVDCREYLPSSSTKYLKVRPLQRLNPRVRASSCENDLGVGVGSHKFVRKVCTRSAGHGLSNISVCET